jgi:signal transduction histidine kinase
MKAEGAVDAAYLYDAQGRPVATFRRRKEGAPVVVEDETELRPWRAPDESGCLHRNQGGKVEAMASVNLHGERHGRVHVQIDLSGRYAQLRWYLPLVVMVTLGAIVIALLLASRLQRHISVPIRGVAEIMRRVSNLKDYQHRARNVSEDEIGLLTHGFNEMLEQIQRHQCQGARCREDPARQVAERTAELSKANEGLQWAVVDANEARRVAEAASRAKSEFLARVGHEIPTLMTGILGTTNLMLDTSLEPRQREHAKAIERPAEWLLELIDDVLDFSELEADRVGVEEAEFDLRALVDDTLDLFAGCAHSDRLKGARATPDCTLVRPVREASVRRCVERGVGVDAPDATVGDTTVRPAA